MAGIEFRDTFKKYLKIIEKLDGEMTKTINDLADELLKDGMEQREICINIVKELKGLVSEQYIRRILPKKYKHEEKSHTKEEEEKEVITVGTDGKQHTSKEEAADKAREEALKRTDPTRNIPDDSKRVIEKMNKDLHEANLQIQKRDKLITDAKIEIQKKDAVMKNKVPALVTMTEMGFVPENDIKGFKGSIAKIKVLIQEKYKNNDEEYLCFIQKLNKVGNK